MKTQKFIIKLSKIFIALLLSNLVYAQQNFVSGIIINLNNEEIPGRIDYRNWDKNPDEIYFRSKANPKKTKYLPSEIKGFKVEDEIYISATVETEVSPFKTADLAQNGNSKLDIEEKTVFLQTMIEGPKSLYHYRDLKGKDNFYIKVDSKITLLVYKKYLKTVEDSHFLSENKKYLGQLSFYFQDQPKIVAKLKSTKYTKASLENLFKQYYSITSNSADFQKDREKVKHEIGIVGGASMTTIDFSSNSFDGLAKAEYNSSVNFAVGLFANFILPRNQGKWAINNEIMYTSFNLKGNYVDDTRSSQIITYDSEIAFSYLKINNLIRLYRPLENSSFFLNAGISNGFVINEQKNDMNLERNLFSSIKTTVEPAVLEPRLWEFGVLFGAGIKFNDRQAIEFRLERGKGMSSHSNLSSNLNRYFFLFAHKF